MPSVGGALYSGLCVIVRLVCLAYIGLCCWGFVEARKLLSGTYELKGDKLFIPLEVCRPSSISIDGNSNIVVDPNDSGSCSKMEYLVNACAMSMLFSAAAVLIYVIVDGMLRLGKGPFRKSTIAGMGLFLLFILLQTAVCVWALWSQARFWVDYFNDVYDALGDGNDYGVKTVQTHANITVLLLVGLLAVVTAAAVLLDAVMALMVLGRPDRSEDAANQAAVAKQMESLNSDTDNDAPYASGSEHQLGQGLDQPPSQKLQEQGGPAWSNI